MQGDYMALRFKAIDTFFGRRRGATYAPVRNGEFRVAPNGDMLLTHLVGATFQRLGRANAQ